MSSIYYYRNDANKDRDEWKSYPKVLDDLDKLNRSLYDVDVAYVLPDADYRAVVKLKGVAKAMSPVAEYSTSANAWMYRGDPAGRGRMMLSRLIRDTQDAIPTGRGEGGESDVGSG